MIMSCWREGQDEGSSCDNVGKNGCNMITTMNDEWRQRDIGSGRTMAATSSWPRCDVGDCVFYYCFVVVLCCCLASGQHMNDEVSIPELLLVFVVWCWWSSFLLLHCCYLVLLCCIRCRCMLCSVSVYNDIQCSQLKDIMICSWASFTCADNIILLHCQYNNISFLHLEKFH